MKYKTIKFAPSNQLNMANKLISTSFEQFLGRIKYPLAR